MHKFCGYGRAIGYKTESYQWPGGDIEYYTRDQTHREDGPALIRKNGKIHWVLCDIQYTFNEWCKKLNKTEGEKAELILEYYG